MDKRDKIDKIEDLLRSKLDDYKIPLPDDSWGRIEDSLYAIDQKRAAFVVRRKWILSSAAAIAVLIVGGMLFMNLPTDNNSVILSEVTTPVISDTPATATAISPEDLSPSLASTESSSNKILDKSSNLIASVNRKTGNKQKEISLAKRKQVNIENDIEPMQLELTEETVGSESVDDSDIINQTYQSDIDEAEMERLIQEFAQQGAEANYFLGRGESNEDNSFTLSLNARGGLNSSQQTVSTPLSLRSSGEKGFASNSKMLMASNLLSSESVTAADLTDNISEMQHQQPVSFGLIVSKSITDRISLETGLIYTYLSSKAKNTAVEFKSNETQSLHYIGIPLNVNYRLFSISKLDIYATLGGVFEKDVYGKYEYVDRTIVEGMNSESENKVSVNIRQKRPQLSVNAGMGIDYPIYNNFSIYGKMGGAYYIDANNKYKTIYSDKKIVLDMNVGIKFDF